ncbi:MAG: hypothetical protein ACRDUX_05710 [Mycobacterium sp.]
MNALVENPNYVHWFMAAVAVAWLYAAGADDESGANASGLRNPVDPFTFRVYEHVRAGGEVVPAGLRCKVACSARSAKRDALRFACHGDTSIYLGRLYS